MGILPVLVIFARGLLKGAIELDAGALRDGGGLVRYPAYFDEV